LPRERKYPDIRLQTVPFEEQDSLSDAKQDAICDAKQDAIANAQSDAGVDALAFAESNDDPLNDADPDKKPDANGDAEPQSDTDEISHANERAILFVQSVSGSVKHLIICRVCCTTAFSGVLAHKNGRENRRGHSNQQIRGDQTCDNRDAAEVGSAGRQLRL
jgi:hypothetical protein